MGLTEYELQREANIARNRALLVELGLDDTSNTTVVSRKTQQNAAAAQKKSDAVAKRRISRNSDSSKENDDGKDNSGRPSKMAKIEAENGPVRRSARNTGKTVDYNAEQDRSAQAYRIKRTHIEMEGDARDANKRVHNPKSYGHIPGIEVGTWWETRQACSTDAIHAPWVGGIAPGPQGAYSVALSGGYEDDVDVGNGFTFTGSGGRDLKGTKDKPKNLRTAPQSSDQSFENNFNKALKRSSETGKPVRVIRGYKLHSPFAPADGYRYDGLYTVEKAWLAPGESKYKVCKFLFKRVPGQPPLPKRVLEERVNNAADDDAEGETENEALADSSQETGSTETLIGEDEDEGAKKA